MRILHVGLPNSVHLARWLDTLAGLGWEHHLVPAHVDPVSTFSPCSELNGVTVYYPLANRPPGEYPGVQIVGVPTPPPQPGGAQSSATLQPPQLLAEVIRTLKPDVIHGHGIQLAGYRIMEAQAAYTGPLPPWIVSCWGSDIYLFGSEPEHAERIREVLESAACYVADNQRDIRLARGFGLRGEAVKVGSVAGGFDLDRLTPYRQPGPTSARRTIMVKGRNVWVYRGRVALEALLRNADVLRGYRVVVYADQESLMRDMVDQLAALPDVEAEFLPHVPYEEILQSHGRARISISLSVSDGTNLSFLEAIALGSFPIQSERSATIEWAAHGETALFVDAEDVDEVAAAIRRALTDDALVDGAAPINAGAIQARLAMAQLRAEATALYEGVVARAAAQRKPSASQGTAVAVNADASPHGTGASAGPTMPEAVGDPIAEGDPALRHDLRVDPRLPLVTIITPTYNRADLLPETIESILRQDYPNLEYIVLDDGSTDDTQALLRNYGDALRWTYHPNMGQPGTVNRGLEMAQGEIIGIISSDDPLLPGAISALVKVLQEDPDLVAVYPDWDVIGEDGKLQYHVDTFEYSYVDMVRFHHTYPGPCTLFRRSVFEQIGGYDPGFRYVPDYDFFLRAGLLGPFRRLPQTLGTYRLHGTAITHAARGTAMAQEHIRVTDKYFERDDLPPEVLAVKSEAYRNAHCIAALVCESGALRPDERFSVNDTLYLRPRTASAPVAPAPAPSVPGAPPRISPAAAPQPATAWVAPIKESILEPEPGAIAAFYDWLSSSDWGARLKRRVPLEWRVATRRWLSKAGRSPS
jgi:GT2 family glycosyltransferase/glycosyltransferase involved in cell wall biosynthesis